MRDQAAACNDPRATARSASSPCNCLIGIYGGYFGAGIGILMLSSLSFLGLKDIHRPTP